MPPALQGFFERVDWAALWTWLLGFGLIAYLGMKGGGYDPLVHDQVGIAVWWVLLVGVLIAAFPRFRLGTPAWAALGLLAAFAAWTALSLTWTESVERSWADLARVAGYVGVFALVLFTQGRGDARRLLSAVATGIAFVALVGLLSRLHPDWFPEANQTARFLDPGRERLSYPIHYWNALGALIAIGLPLLVQIATGARSLLVRALAAAAMPALALTLFFTLSRSGIAAAFVALVVFLALASDRLPKLLTLLVSGAGGAVLIAAGAQRDALQEGLLNSVARQQGDEMIPIVLGVCLLVGLAQVGLSLALSEERRPGWTVVPRNRTLAAAATGLAVALIAMAAFNAPGRASDAWGEFKEGDGPGSGAGRLNSAAGQSRYQFWSSAVRENATDPLTGTGSGTFEFWWTRDGDRPEIVRDTHSLYFQTLGELGIVGLALLGGFLVVFLVGGGREILRARAEARSRLAAALAGSIAFCLTAGFDWMWQIPVLPIALLLLVGVLVMAEVGGEGTAERAPGLSLPLRLGFAALALATIVAIAIPLASASLVRQSKADAREGDMSGALEAAKSAQNVQPSAATPRLQQALVLEAQGQLAAASAAATAAAERESTNWRTWLILSRIEARQGHAAAAVADYRRARSLNPLSELFER